MATTTGMRSKALTLGFILTTALSAPAWGKTLVVEGDLNGTVTIHKQVNFSLEKPLSTLTYQFPIPADGGGAGTSQRISDFSAESVPPAAATDETDRFGNRYRKLVWKNLTGDARVNISYTSAVRSGLAPRTSSAPFPVDEVSEDLRIYLQETSLVQSGSPKIKELAARLTGRETTRYGAVDAILNYVCDAIAYQYTPPKYDALYGLETGKGNCQNYAHLALALLRASGIPSRLVVGQTLKDQWKIPLDDNGSSLVEGMGEGLHAWIEVYFPDQGWLPCDPQQSRFFTSTRHIKYGHGLDAGDVKEFWQGSPSLPRFSDSLDAHFTDDQVSLHLRSTGVQPDKRYLVSAANLPAAPPPPVKVTPPPIPVTPQPIPVLPPPVQVTPPIPVAPPPVQVTPPPKPVTPPAAPAPKPGSAIDLGNTDFPALLEIYQESGNTGTRSFERETAEYATSRNVYAQAFVVAHPMKVSLVSLAMKKFGGDGMVYLDLVADEKGKPSLTGVRSSPISLERIKRGPGYAWVDFPLPADTAPLAPGKYWVVLRHSGEAIMNWFYTPGKGFGGPDDTRSTARGWQWEDVLTYDFVFRVRGKIAKLAEVKR